MTDEEIAEVCHEINRVWCQANGDYSQPSWVSAPDWQKESAIGGVKFHKENPDAGDSASHSNWMRQKFSEGWIYGSVKDSAKKQHPCMVDFEQLPMDQQIKDALFRHTVHQCLRMK